MPKDQAEVPVLLRQLQCADSDRAWEMFVDEYGPLLLQVVHFFERDPDRTRDCFLFVCEKLSVQRFRRLRKYDARDQATFTTWLRCVTRNLCIDWRRSISGRPRPFKVIQALPLLEQEVYRLHFVQRLSLEETAQIIRQDFPAVTDEQVSTFRERIYDLLSPRQLWLLSNRAPALFETPGVSRSETGIREVADPARNPEEKLLEKEATEHLSLGLAQLSPRERQLIHLRFEEGCSLQVCADALGLENPQKVHRMVSSVLSRLRALLSN